LVINQRIFLKKIFSVIAAGFLLQFFFIPLSGQNYFRIKADFSVKEKDPDGNSRLYTGKVFYDKTRGEIIYDIEFPSKELLVVRDSLIIRKPEGEEARIIPNLATNALSVFDLSLNGHLDNYGLDKLGFKLDSVEIADKMMISHWLPPKKAEAFLGEILLSQEDRKLTGVVYLSPERIALQKQFFRNYTETGGLAFPTEMIEVKYNEGKEFYKITSFGEVEINDLHNDASYRYELPSNFQMPKQLLPEKSN